VLTFILTLYEKEPITVKTTLK